MSEEGLHIDTHGALSAPEKEHASEQAKQDSVTAAAMDEESSSEEIDESPIFDTSNETNPDLSPTTPIHPEHDVHDLEKSSEVVESAEPIEAETTAEKSSLLNETNTTDEHLDEEAENTEVTAPGEDEHSQEESLQNPSTPEPSVIHEAQPRSEEESLEEKPQKTSESSISGVEEVAPNTPYPSVIEPGTALEEEKQEPSETNDKKLEELAGDELPESTLSAPVEAEAAVQASQAPIQDAPIPTNQTPSTPSKPLPSDRSKLALDVVKRSRNQFRVALDVFLQLINEAEDDEGIVRLNLVARDTDLRKAVEMLGLKLKGLSEAERDADHAELLDRYEAKKSQEE